jgi:hypothetical protein
MSQGTLTYNLMDPAEKKMFDAATNGWRYKRVLDDLVKIMSTASKHHTGGEVLRKVEELAAQHGVDDVRDSVRRFIAEGRWNDPRSLS